jgi:hypothetical protein
LIQLNGFSVRRAPVFHNKETFPMMATIAEGTALEGDEKDVIPALRERATVPSLERGLVGRRVPAQLSNPKDGQRPSLHEESMETPRPTEALQRVWQLDDSLTWRAGLLQ